ncbi:hypothetical protein LCGC14_1802430 [marine sediment metagenome]|uniref:Uncharacterized protein n=1 Tax=marine sediment metagenome TaxID=412755 RepID=A0A0F9JNV3_9ZZZZ
MADADNFYDNLMGEEGNADVNNALAGASDEVTKALESEETPGQEVDSPPAKDTSKPDEEGAKKEESPASEENEVKKEKSPPYDKDPKWIAARAAEAKLTELLSKTGFETTEDLETALESGKSLKELLGSRDAKKLIADSETLSKAVQKRDAEKLSRMEEEETPEQTIARLKQDNDNLYDFNKKQEDEKIASLNTDRALSTFNERIASTVDGTEGLSDSEKSLLNQFLGVDNPLNDVDMEDLSEVSKLAKTGIKDFQGFVKNVRQQAIDEYAAGNSKLTPISKTENSGETPSVKKTNLSKDASIDETFDAAKSELLEIFANVGVEGMFED